MQLLPIISYIIQQTGNENIQTDRVEVVVLVKHQILIVNLQGNLLQLRGDLTIGSWELECQEVIWLVKPLSLTVLYRDKLFKGNE